MAYDAGAGSIVSVPGVAAPVAVKVTGNFYLLVTPGPPSRGKQRVWAKTDSRHPFTTADTSSWTNHL
jgi:hypothetical protein